MTPACPREWFRFQHDMSDSRSIVSNMVGDEDRVVDGFAAQLGTRLVWGIVIVMVGLAMDALAPIHIRGRTPRPFRQ